MSRSVYQRIMEILDDEENMSHHLRRSYWAREIERIVREDERQRVEERVRRDAAYLPTDQMFDVVNAIRGGINE